MEKKLNMRTICLADEKFRALSALFPNAVTETIDESGAPVRAIDADVLRQEINSSVTEGGKERYQFTWPDKKRAILLANSPVDKTLRPCREESVNFDATENLYIEGDNLDVLKLLRETYLNKVKMIYIDPPYNTGNDFIYEDDFAMETGEFLTRDGQLDEAGRRMVRNLDSNGRFHTDWLNMIYPRLKAARDLLTEDGVILINMDENEVTNLQKICYELFGEVNDLGTIVWDKRNPKGDARGIAYQHEYILLFAKNKEAFFTKCKTQRPKKNAVTMLDKAEQLFKRITPSYTFEQANKEYARWVYSQSELTGGEKAYNAFDLNGSVYRAVSMAWPNNQKAPDNYFIPLIHPNTGKPCPIPAKGWRFPDKSMDMLLKNGEILFGDDETTQPRRKYLLKENMYDNIPSLLYYGGSDSGMLSSLGIPFDTPKVVAIVKEHVQSFTSSGDIVLDFFSGSATTAHAVMKLNAEDGGRRKFIMVQIPETTDESSEAFKAGYKNICEIGKERIRRAGAKIKEEAPVTTTELDTGFRVLKLDSSNMKEVYYTPQEYIDLDFEGLIDNIKGDRTEDDLLFQVMLELGIPLSAKIEVKDIEGRAVYYAQGRLIASFGKVDEAVLTKIAMEKPVYAVFRDSSFASDSALVNFEQIFKTYSPNTERRVL